MDVVLLDVPCSGSGTWRRNPDAKWNLQAENLNALKQLQADILQSASRLVKPGGRLIYSTCSLLNCENEQQVSQFLQENDMFEPALLANASSLEGLQITQGSQLRTSPAQSNMDGFFVAALVRK